MAGRKARVEGEASPVAEVPAVSSRVLGGIVERFKADFPDDWEALRLCPLQHGIETMIEKLNG